MADFKIRVESRNLLVTGAPGVGKTTFIQKLAERLGDFSPKGFYTEEIRENGRRKGFRIETFEGVKRVLAHININSPHRVSRYNVDITALDEIVTELNQSQKYDDSLWLIDEVGKMEAFSPLFREFIESLLADSNLVVATISQSAGGWIKQIRNRSDVQLIELSIQDRDQMLEKFVNQIHSILNK